jgi:hypothetical protein
MATTPLSVTLNGVTAKIRWESFRKGRGENGPYVALSYLVPYAQTDNFIDGVMGGISGGSGTVQYLPRQKCPTNPTLYATRAEGDYVGEVYPNSGTSSDLFQYSTVAVEYGVLAWPQAFGDDPGGQQSFPNDATPGEPYLFAECDIDFGGKLITLPKGSYLFPSGAPIYANVPATKWEAMSTWRVTRQNFPSLPYAKVGALVNKVNSTTFLGQAPEHVRFAGAQTQLRMTSDGTRCQRFAMSFEVQFECTWNQLMRPDDLKYDNVEGTLTGAPPYTLDDLRPLLS